MFRTEANTALPLLPGIVGSAPARRRAVAQTSGFPLRAREYPQEGPDDWAQLQLLKKPATGALSAGGCLCFGAGIAIFVSLLCLAIPPVPQLAFGDSVRVESDATCFRASREDSYAVVELALGSPMHVLRLLLLFDQVAVGNQSSVRIFSSRVAESKSLKCGDSSCNDIALVQEGSDLRNRKVRLFFEYNSLLLEESSPQSHAYELGLDGDVRLTMDKTHLLLRASYCVQARTDWISTYESELVGGLPTLPISDAKKLLPDGPLSNCANENDRVEMLPSASVREHWWLALTSTRILQTTASQDRRKVVEAGAVCGNAEYPESRRIFLLDCAKAQTSMFQPQRSCNGGASIPFRRVAHRILRIDTSVNNNGDTHFGYGIEDDLTLHDPDADATHEFSLSILKLVLLLLTAAVVFTRSNRETSSNALIFMDAYFVSQGKDPLIRSSTRLRDVIEDGTLGGLTIVGRCVVVYWKAEGLIADGHARIVVLQSVAAAVAILHWALRYTIEFYHHKKRNALARLGGSTAIVDSTAAVILAFADVPLLSSSYESFGGSARLLTAMLLTSVALQRCIFAISSCGLRMGSSKGRKRAMPALCILLWTVQSISIGALLVDVFAHPAGYHLGRARSGDATGFAAAAAAAVLAASGTAFTRTTLAIFDEIDASKAPPPPPQPLSKEKDSE